MSEEGIAIRLIVSALAWLVAVVLAFYFVGAVAGVFVILAGAYLFVWWLARVIRSEPPVPGSTGR